ncbi:hypothetical protein ANCCEY_11114 [Ancylostoma ceylanicum]|uniref:GSKIP domain-containing protein n=2 Tax=Ancylostoma ceylanicum TaxID=53326 RepID=A0A0D6LD52_9BILA|nr:hypothetical protein ANCCEY_11114 [Ancylostoma ceylanicum]EYB84642.1 hypothetical protein Y032_0313g2204 [Ancylostoma ceylanicum]
MSQSATSSPPPTPSHSPILAKAGYQSPPCICGSVPLASLSANTLADSLGVSPLYKQQDSARWTAAAQVYHSSRAHSPTQEGQFNFPDVPAENLWVNPQQLVTSFIHKNSAIRTPLSLEDIANMNRKRHVQEGGVIRNEAGGPLELEAIAAVHELSHEVQDISVSEMLPRTSDLIFVNVKTQEGQPYTLELTLKGWRIASSHTDCMNGDYTKVDLHTRYFRNARELLSFISPDHATRFNECLANKLNELAATDPTFVTAS